MSFYTGVVVDSYLASRYTFQRTYFVSCISWVCNVIISTCMCVCVFCPASFLRTRQRNSSRQSHSHPPHSESKLKKTSKHKMDPRANWQIGPCSRSLVIYRRFNDTVPFCTILWRHYKSARWTIQNGTLL